MGLLKVLDIVCGENHSMTLVEMTMDGCVDRSLFVWGANDKRQLGIDEDFDDIKVPHQLEPCPFKKDGLNPK